MFQKTYRKEKAQKCLLYKDNVKKKSKPEQFRLLEFKLYEVKKLLLDCFCYF